MLQFGCLVTFLHSFAILSAVTKLSLKPSSKGWLWGTLGKSLFNRSLERKDAFHRRPRQGAWLYLKSRGNFHSSTCQDRGLPPCIMCCFPKWIQWDYFHPLQIHWYVSIVQVQKGFKKIQTHQSIPHVAFRCFSPIPAHYNPRYCLQPLSPVRDTLFQTSSNNFQDTMV